jgi:hypothetical protein
MKKITKANLKPVDFEAHFKYRCPTCSCEHWLSYKQAKTKHFKVVCDCNTVFEVKTIKSIKAVYLENSIPTITHDKKVEEQPSVATKKIPVDILNKCNKILVGYGFTVDESTNMLDKAYATYPNNDYITLIKIALGNTLGDKNG